MGHEMREFRLIAGIGPGGRDIAGLHGQINLFSLSAHDVFDGPDEFGEFHGAAVAHIEDGAELEAGSAFSASQRGSALGGRGRMRAMTSTMSSM